MLSCCDRIIVTGTLPGACYAAGVTGFLSARLIRIFDYPRFAEPLRDRVRAAELASAAGVTIEHIAKKHIRKEDMVAKVLTVRGDHPGLVHIISAMEACDTYKPWHDKQTHCTFLRPDTGKCLHYYFYFIEAELGLIYLRVPTWCPFRLQFYCNGHSWLTRQLAATGIGFTLADNAFLRIDDWQCAQTLADRLSPDDLHRILDRYVQQCCPVLDVFAQSYHWSFMQVEYATDLVFRSQAKTKEAVDAHFGEIGQPQPTRRGLLPEDDVLLGPIERPPRSDAPFQRPADTGAKLRMAALDLVENGHWPQTRGALQHGTTSLSQTAATASRTQGNAILRCGRAVSASGESRSRWNRSRRRLRSKLPSESPPSRAWVAPLPGSSSLAPGRPGSKLARHHLGRSPSSRLR